LLKDESEVASEKETPEEEAEEASTEQAVRKM
jgi:hypothetical protein